MAYTFLVRDSHELRGCLQLLNSGAHDDLAVATTGVVVRAARNAGVVRDRLGLIWAMKPEKTPEEKFDEYVRNWLLDIPQKPWKTEDDLVDFDDFDDFDN